MGRACQAAAHADGRVHRARAVLEASTLELIARTRRLDPLGAGLLVPCALWGGYATALSARIAATDPSTAQAVVASSASSWRVATSGSEGSTRR